MESDGRTPIAPDTPTTYVLEGRVYFCPVNLAIEAISGKWKTLVIWHLVQHDVMRYGELKRSLRGITHKMLTQSLRELEADGFVLRTVRNVVPPHVEYRLSVEGRRLVPVMHALRTFGRAYEAMQDRRGAGRSGRVPDGEGPSDAAGDGVGSDVSEALGEGDGDAVGEPPGLGVGVAVEPGVGVGVPPGLAVGDGDGVGLGVGLGDGVGHGARALPSSSETVTKRKPRAL